MKVRREGYVLWVTIEHMNEKVIVTGRIRGDVEVNKFTVVKRR